MRSETSAQHFGPENSDPCLMLYLVSHICVSHTPSDYHSRLCFLLARDVKYLVGLIYFQVLTVILQVLKRYHKTHSIVGLGWFIDSNSFMYCIFINITLLLLQISVWNFFNYSLKELDHRSLLFLYPNAPEEKLQRIGLEESFCLWIGQHCSCCMFLIHQK